MRLHRREIMAGMAVHVIASSVPALEPTLMNETNTAVIARLDRATQYSRDV
jgi:hypothetical protein